MDIAPVDEQGYGRNEGTDYKMEKNITFCTSEENLSVFIEEFGEQSIQIDSREDELRLHVRTADTRAIKFGIDHFDTVTVISPISVRSSVMDRLRRGIDRYA